MSLSAIASNPIFAAIFDINYEPDISALKRHALIIRGIINDQGLAIKNQFNFYEDFDVIDRVIIDYSLKTMTNRDIQTIICEYGIAKAMKLFSNYRIFDMGYNDISEFLAADNNNIEREIIYIIMKEEIGFQTDWRINDFLDVNC
jgi:hypothetical protein